MLQNERSLVNSTINELHSVSWTPIHICSNPFQLTNYIAHFLIYISHLPIYKSKPTGMADGESYRFSALCIAPHKAESDISDGGSLVTTCFSTTACF